ncbi:hypothetical protein [Burkholderia gladioli]|uniref:hypothetical protein n=1 Tax=Burkholderia gladioli TaxID=28095 RepID=UPI00163F94B2|nr:hypothetical protein [Burkholderia gladioli]
MAEAQEKVSKPVKVYCKLPHGIAYQMPDGRTVTLTGFYGARRADGSPSGVPGTDTVLGFGVTTVEAEDWAKIVELHGKSAAHVNGFVFAEKDDKSSEAKARENETEKTGFEPYDPNAAREDRTVDGTKNGELERK